MPVSPVSRRELVARLRRLGFDGPYAGGRHAFMERGKVRVPIPNPHHGDLSTALLREVLRLAGVQEEEWLGS